MCERNFLTDLSVSSSGYERQKYMDSYRGENPCPGCIRDCMKFIGPRRDLAMRVYNLCEGLTSADDMLPDRFFDTEVTFGRLKEAAA